jgi:PDZ domain-containing protein
VPRLRRSAFALALTAAVLAGSLAVTPTPFWLIGPGNAVDLSTRVAVEGYAPPRDRYYLTDVTVTRASLLLLAEGLVPGVRVVREDALVPGGESPLLYDRLLVDAMRESQQVAAVVAERAAGFHLGDPPTRTVVAGILPSSLARGVLAVGDVLLAVSGRPVAKPHDVGRVLSRSSAGRFVSVELERAGRRLAVRVKTIRTPKGVRLGLILETRSLQADLPVAVHFALGNVEGSSGGLMLALQIYAQLRPARDRRPRAIAGTGTLAYDGSVGRIEGAAQKLIAAQRAGAGIFLIPKANYGDVAAARDIRIVPVGSFREALAALRS